MICFNLHMVLLRWSKVKYAFFFYFSFFCNVLEKLENGHWVLKGAWIWPWKINSVSSNVFCGCFSFEASFRWKTSKRTLLHNIPAVFNYIFPTNCLLQLGYLRLALCQRLCQIVALLVLPKLINLFVLNLPLFPLFRCFLRWGEMSRQS